MPFSHWIHVPLVQMTGLLLLAVTLGGLVGWERERHDQPAGLRTHILVCVGSALITLVDNRASGSGGRIAAQIVTGVGFLGAGTILRAGDGSAVRGLTTAASVWMVAGVGIAIGYGGTQATLAVIATLIMLFTLAGLNQIEDTLLRRRRRQRLSVVFAAACDPLANLQSVLQFLSGCGTKVRDFRLEKMTGNEAAHFWLRLPRGFKRETVDDWLSRNKDVIHFDWDE